MARANLNKSEEVLKNTTAVSIKAHVPKRPFQTQTYLVKVPLNVNIVKQVYFIKTVFENLMK